jgi:xylose isomerase
MAKITDVLEEPTASFKVKFLWNASNFYCFDTVLYPEGSTKNTHCHENLNSHTEFLVHHTK